MVTTPKHNNVLLILHNCKFAVNIWYRGYVTPMGVVTYRWERLPSELRPDFYDLQIYGEGIVQNRGRLPLILLNRVSGERLGAGPRLQGSIIRSCETLSVLSQVALNPGCGLCWLESSQMNRKAHRKQREKYSSPEGKGTHRSCPSYNGSWKLFTLTHWQKFHPWQVYLCNPCGKKVMPFCRESGLRVSLRFGN